MSIIIKINKLIFVMNIFKIKLVSDLKKTVITFWSSVSVAKGGSSLYKNSQKSFVI